MTSTGVHSDSKMKIGDKTTPKSQSSTEHLKAIAQREWERLRVALELECGDYVVKKDLNRIELLAPGKKMTFIFDSAAQRHGRKPTRDLSHR